ncbi:MAG TPA: acyl-CoA dehydratase activase [Deltaproteobacteria bacterium]|nr:activase [Deltaproteobacteria bacterium]OQC29450.1 MAG: R-phenyllactate dehydratase activator [Deltaproteobacteria bacterium ADurb.Bin072]NMD40898.1 activase [Deltaproteobacteria bacterium]HNQ84294.1 acyl-CoA dehydratase activase [Deltaproteobacteria bacterium]HNS90242.1 acyl-CoA dehydratase activase [Deltaproteobacteria bacterium]
MDKRNRYFGGCDVGSTTGKAVILDEGGSIVASSIVPTEIDPELTSTIAMDKACASVPGLSSFRDLACLVGTGYGRNEVAFADRNVSEISCHAMGTFSCDPRIKTIVDIGGQDVKAIAVDKDGSVLEFAMNDKCAAGTGRFFEAMSRTFRMDLDKFSELSLRAKKVIPITSQCSVFAESEVISLLARRNPPEDVAAGIQAAVSKRCFTLLKRIGMQPLVTVTGGCAKNRGLIKALARIITMEVTSLPVDPQIIGALGAAVFARREFLNRKGA